MPLYMGMSVIHGLLTDSLYNFTGLEDIQQMDILHFSIQNLEIMNDKNQKCKVWTIIALIVFIILVCIHPIYTIGITWIVLVTLDIILPS